MEKNTDKAVNEDLEEEIKSWHKKHFKSRNAWEDYSGHYLDKNSQLDLARHFVQWEKNQIRKEIAKQIAFYENSDPGKDPYCKGSDAGALVVLRLFQEKVVI